MGVSLDSKLFLPIRLKRFELLLTCFLDKKFVLGALALTSCLKVGSLRQLLVACEAPLPVTLWPPAASLLSTSMTHSVAAFS